MLYCTWITGAVFTLYSTTTPFCFIARHLKHSKPCCLGVPITGSYSERVFRAGPYSQGLREFGHSIHLTC